jgi:hypothetical protein
MHISNLVTDTCTSALSFQASSRAHLLIDCQPPTQHVASCLLLTLMVTLVRTRWGSGPPSPVVPDRSKTPAIAYTWALLQIPSELCSRAIRPRRLFQSRTTESAVRQSNSANHHERVAQVGLTVPPARTDQARARRRMYRGLGNSHWSPGVGRAVGTVMLPNPRPRKTSSPGTRTVFSPSGRI